MAATDETTTESTQAASAPAAAHLLVCLSSAYADLSSLQTSAVLRLLQRALAGTQTSPGQVTVAYPSVQTDAPQVEQEGFTLVPYADGGSGQALTVHTAANWISVAAVLRAHGAAVGLLLGAEAQSLVPEALAGMMDAALLHGADLALPQYTFPPNQGLLNQAILAPLSRALFSARIGFPLALDVAFSSRMADRMAQAAQRVPASAQNEAIVWPVSEAALAGYNIAEVIHTTRELPEIPSDLSQILQQVAGSLFSDIEAKATFWQRTRPAKETLRLDASALPEPEPTDPANDEEIDDLLASFRIGYNNLHDIWSLVLPPQTLVSLKRLSLAQRETFAMPESIWVRIVYDFVLAHRLRTLSRGHLLGALTPLYLAWVASHLLALRNGSARSAEQLGIAFEADRPYLVSRWRWPDRFNP